MGGEKLLAFFLRRSLPGSPPHGRGKVCSLSSGLYSLRITPAWAGKSFRTSKQQQSTKDHPRMGGEKIFCDLFVICSGGSPPHGRGKVEDMKKAGLNPRITPAWAGKSYACCPVLTLSKDHPRMGGEKWHLRQRSKELLGSPPHGRGKGKNTDRTERTAGITPAWAGKRLKRSHRSGIFISGPIPFHSVLHRPAGSGGSRAGRDGSPAGQPQNAGPA